MTDEELRRVLLPQGYEWLRRRAEINALRLELDGEDDILADKLEALEKLIGEIPDANAVVLDTEDMKEHQEQDQILTNMILKAIGELKGSAQPREIKRWIMANCGSRITGKASQPYFYTVLSRHARSGQLIKDDNGYRLPPERLDKAS